MSRCRRHRTNLERITTKVGSFSARSHSGHPAAAAACLTSWPSAQAKLEPSRTLADAVASTRALLATGAATNGNARKMRRPGARHSWRGAAGPRDRLPGSSREPVPGFT